MRLRITGDVNNDSGVAEIIYEGSGATEKQMAQHDYGPGLTGIGVVLMFVAKSLLPYDVFGAGFLLAMSGGIVIWAVGYEASA